MNITFEDTFFVCHCWQVLDVNDLIKSRMDTHKAKQIELAKQEALESAIATVRAKLREKEESKLEIFML